MFFEALSLSLIRTPLLRSSSRDGLRGKDRRCVSHISCGRSLALQGILLSFRHCLLRIRTTLLRLLLRGGGRGMGIASFSRSFNQGIALSSFGASVRFLYRKRRLDKTIFVSWKRRMECADSHHVSLLVYLIADFSA